MVLEYFFYQSERRSKHQPGGHSRHPWCFHVFFLWKRRGDIFMFPTKCIGILGKITKCDSCQKIWCFLSSVQIYKVVVRRPCPSAGHSGYINTNYQMKCTPNYDIFVVSLILQARDTRNTKYHIKNTMYQILKNENARSGAT